MANYEYYEITAEKCTKSDTGNEITGPNNDAEYDIIKFKVQAVSHTQHIWHTTHLNGLSKSASDKIQRYKDNGYRMTTTIGDRDRVLIDN